jgi:hypothetical protein
MGVSTLVRLAGLTAAEIDAMRPAVIADIRNRNIHSYLPVYVVYGRKPLDVDGEVGTEVTGTVAAKQDP